jgi:LPXTG-motif cell wall-anchored protein
MSTGKQKEVKIKSVSAITPYSGTGSKTGRILLYVGIGVASLLALTALLYFFRRHHRLAMQPAFHPASMNPAAWNTPPANVASPVVNQASQRCPNPQCGKEVPAGKKFCAHCGTCLNV